MTRGVVGRPSWFTSTGVVSRCVERRAGVQPCDAELAAERGCLLPPWSAVGGQAFDSRVDMSDSFLFLSANGVGGKRCRPLRA